MKKDWLDLYEVVHGSRVKAQGADGGFAGVEC